MRGGIGIFLSTGAARGSLSRLPEARKATKAWQQSEGGSFSGSTRPPSNCSGGSCPPRGGATQAQQLDVGSLAAAAAASVVVGGGACLPEEAKREWERVVAHPHNFVATGRQTRTEDVRPASMWSAVSFFENHPAEVKRHMDIMGIMDQAHYEVRAVDLVLCKPDHWESWPPLRAG